MARRLNKPVTYSYIKLILPFSLLGVLCFAALTVKSFAALVSSAVKNPGQQILHQSIEYDYRVYPVESILFPVGTEPLPPGQESYYADLTERIQFQATGSVSAPEPLDGAKSNLRVKLFLRSEGQWNKELPFEAEITVSQPESGILNYNATFDLPLEEAKRLGEAIQEELQGRPRSDGFSLVIGSTLSTALAEPDNPAPEEKKLYGEYEFALDGLQIRPRGEWRFENAVHGTGTGTIPNKIGLLGLPVNVITGRILFPIIFLIFGSTAGCSYIKLKQDRFNAMSKAEQMAGRIRKHYGSRLIKASTLRSAASICIVEVTDYRELTKIADGVERPIIEVISEHNPEIQQVGYYVVDGEALYCFKLNSASYSN